MNYLGVPAAKPAVGLEPGNVDFFRQYLLDRRVNLPNIVAANTTAFPSLNLGTLPWKP